jgi:hypothetical protein
VHDDRDHDEGVYQVSTVGDSAEWVEELAGEQLVHIACRHIPHTDWYLHFKESMSDKYEITA